MAQLNISLEAERLIDSKAKPPKSLGTLEHFAVQICTLQNSLKPRVERAALIVCCGDHGIVSGKDPATQSVSAYPQQVTAAIFNTLAVGKAAGTVLAAANGIEKVLVADVGIDCPEEALVLSDGLFVETIVHKIDRGTRDYTQTAAMTTEQCAKAVEFGKKLVRDHCEGKFQVICLGEVGIGNTTSAAALICAILGEDPSNVCGRGTGVDDQGLARKVRAVETAIQLHSDDVKTGDPLKILASMGGFEIAALVGVVLESYEKKIAVIVDGFITSAAALIAFKVNPSTKDVMFFSHLSEEKGMMRVAEYIGRTPVLHLHMRLGEGTGKEPFVRLIFDLMLLCFQEL
jgi:nicotinate-nucleotide--dimethylbenzimidazole phosphoribosyltransferase